MALNVVNPATGEIVQTYEEMTPEAIAERIAAAETVSADWRRISAADRAALLASAANVLENEVEGLASLMAMEMGKPIKDGRAEIKKCAWLCRYYAEAAAGMLAPEAVATDASKSFVVFEPLGVVLGIMPWNYPFWQVFRFAVPAMAAGNAALLKHASNTPGCALAVEAVLQKAGFPDKLFQSLLVRSQDAGVVIDHPSVRAVTFTGSTEAGRAIAARAGGQLKKTVLELGGSDPYVILEDADLETAVDACVAARLLNSGQSCVAAKRFIVVEPVLKDFEEGFVEKMKSVRMGEPLAEESDIGPQARGDLREQLHKQVHDSIKKGAACLLGGEIPQGQGFYYPPTVLRDVRPGMPVFDDETFGPVAAIIAARDGESAVALANRSRFGLGAAVFTRDSDRGERIASRQLQAGNCFVNGFVKSDPRLPFGGIKDSGYGRELSHYGIKEFVNIKSVYIA